jgi:hypothetical protein
MRSGSLEKAHPEFFFEAFDLPGERGLCEA